MTRYLTLTLALLTQCAAPALAQTVAPDQAKAASSIASTYFTQTGNPLYACDPSQPDGFNPTWYDHLRPDVVAAKLDPRDHYRRYGIKERTPPCEAAPADAVTRDQARGGLAIVTSYLAQAQAQSQATRPSPYAADPNRADGFNPIWYNHAYPDVAAAGIDPLRHFIDNGVWEGRLPYEGAPPFAAESLYSSKAPEPKAVMRDVYAAPGETSVVQTVCLERHGAPVERSYRGGLYASNSEGGHVNIGNIQPVEAEQLFLPTNGGCARFTIPVPAGQTGWFNAGFKTIDNPFATVNARVYVNTASPAGYAALVAPAATPAPIEPVVTAWDFQDDFLGDLTAKGWQIGGGGGGVNNMTGVWLRPGVRPSANPYPIETIDGQPTRVLRPVDVHANPIDGHPWAMPMLLLPQGVGPGVIQLTFAIYDAHTGEDLGWWSIKEGEVWPPEYDWFEVWQPIAQMTAHDNDAVFKQSNRLPIVTDGKFHRMTIERTRDFRLHAWVDGALVVDTPDYLRGQRMNTKLSIEGLGGAGGAIDPAFDYSRTGFALRGFAFKRYGG